MSGIIGGAGSKSGIIGQTEIDYEEGTFTPVKTAGSGGVYGYYTKIGRVVNAYFGCDDINTSGTSAWSLSGFPFTATARVYGSVGISGHCHRLVGPDNETMVVMTIGQSTSIMVPRFQRIASSRQLAIAATNDAFNHSQSGLHGLLIYDAA